MKPSPVRPSKPRGRARAMTEAEWLSGDHPTPMLRWLGGRGSRRKLVLLGCACCRGWDAPVFKDLIHLAERLADGEVTAQDFRAAFSALPGYLFLPTIPTTIDSEMILQWVDADRLASLVSQLALARSAGRPR